MIPEIPSKLAELLDFVNMTDGVDNVENRLKIVDLGRDIPVEDMMRTYFINYGSLVICEYLYKNPQTNMKDLIKYHDKIGEVLTGLMELKNQ